MIIKIGEENVVIPAKIFVPHAEFLTVNIKGRSKGDQKTNFAKSIKNKENGDDGNFIFSDSPSPQLALDSERNHLYNNEREINKIELERTIKTCESIQEVREKMCLVPKVRDVVSES